DSPRRYLASTPIPSSQSMGTALGRLPSCERRRSLHDVGSPIVDGHLDIAWNALTQRHGFVGSRAPGYLVNRSTLARAGVGLVIATLFCGPAVARRRLESDFVYSTPAEARLMALAELGYYHGAGLRLVTSRRQLQDYVSNWRP